MVTGSSSGAVTFSAMQLPGRIAGIVEQNDRGRIPVTQGSARRSILFAGGRISQIASALESERIGSWLVARGVASRTAVEGASAGRSDAERLAESLVRQRVISAPELANELRLLSLAIAARMLGEDGIIERVAGDEGAEAPASLDVDPLELFVGSARRNADAGRFEGIAGGESRWTAAAVVPQRAARIELGGLEKFVLAHLNGPRSLAELRQAAPDQRVELVRALTVLVVAGLAVPASPAGGTPGGERPERVAGQDRTAGRYVLLPAASPQVKARLAAIEAPASPAVPAAGREAELRNGPEPPPAKPEPTGEQLDAAVADRQEAFDLLHRGEDPRAAYRLLTRVAEVAPDAEVLLEMARIELANPLWRQRALDHLKSALAINPTLTAAWLDLANYWSLRGEPEKQRRCLEAVLRYDPRNVEVREALDLVRGGGT